MSGIYIPGMEMPTSCGDCKAFVCYRQWAGDPGDCFCGITKEDAKAKEKNADCPLIEVPTPHGRLIDADAMTEKAFEMSFGNRITEYGLFVLNRGIQEMPTIIPADKELNNDQ